MVDHMIPLQCLHLSCGLSVPPLLWFKYYLFYRTQMDVLGEILTTWVRVEFGLPQSSVLDPILYLLYTADIHSLFIKHLTTGRFYADPLSLDLHQCVSANRLCLNSSKTQINWFGTKQQSLKLDLPLLRSMYPKFTFLSNVCDLGVTLNRTISFFKHLTHLMRSGYYQFWGVWELSEDLFPLLSLRPRSML